jgi:3-deoxy-manno-octulosonate cytidylyltransferase (CMP-KDO synthetase)
MTRAVAVIPARYASVRFPGKALVEVGGKPLIQHVWERARLLTTVERVVVATDDERIAGTVRGFGGAVVMTSPAHPSGTDRVAEAVRGDPAGLVVNLQGDEPTFDAKAVDEVVTLMADAPAIEMGTLAHPIRDPAEHHDTNATKVVLDPAGYALYFSRAPIPFARRPGLVTPLRHIGIYVFRAAFLQRFAALPPTPLEQTEALEQLRALEHGARIRVLVTPHASLGVDTPADLARLAAYLAGAPDPADRGGQGRGST